ncbi:MAG: immunoglobulin domain-containing protein, partial [Opitutales bacterium]
MQTTAAQSPFYEQFERHEVLPPQWYSPAGVETEENAFYSWTYPRTEPFTSHYTDYGIFQRPVNSGASGDENVYLSDVTNRMETEGADNLGSRQFFTDSGGTELPYYLLTPPDYDPDDTTTTYPLLMVLHGQGGVGKTTPTQESLFMALDENQQQFPAFVLSPTFPERPVDYADENDPNGELKKTEVFDAFMELVDQLMDDERIDTDRIYSTGFSMGGATTWTILFERPDLLSAAAPFAGGPGGNDLTRTVAEAALFKDTAIWSGIGTHDFIGASWGSLGALNYRMMYDKVRQAGHGAIRHWEIPDMDHSSSLHFRRLLATVEWMFAHRKGQDIDPGFMHVPHDATVETNGSVRLEGYAFGRPEATHYEWTHDGATLTGEDGPVLELDQLTPADSGKYAVTAFYPDGSSITSPEGRLEVLPTRAPKIVSSPEDATAYTGKEVVFSVEVEGTGPISYVWSHDGTPLTESADIAGVDTQALTLSDLSLAAAGTYTLSATNSEGSATTSVDLVMENNPYYETQDLRAWIPDTDTLPVLRGILVNGNGAGSNNMAAANNPLIQEWALQHGFIVIGTSIGNMGEQPEWDTFVSQLDTIASQSGRPELNHAPMLFWGHSMGGQSAYGAARGLPDRMIAFNVNKGSNYVRDHGSDPWHIPALMIAGESDTDLRRDNIRGLFEEGRAEGAPWAWLEEHGVGHSLGNSMQIVFAFFDEILPLRYPDDPDNVPTATAAPTLIPVDQSTGWLVEDGQAAWSTGYSDIEAQSAFTGDPLTRGWVPTERMARLYRTLASYVDDFNLRLDNGKHFIIDRPHDSLKSFDGEVAATVRYAPSESLPFGFDLIGSPDWTEIRIYDYDQLIETIPASSETRFDLELDLDHTQPSNVIHMEMDLSNGEKRTSFMIFAKSTDTEPLHFIRAPRDSAALAGGTVRLSASVGGSGPLSYQWSKDGSDIAGATDSMLELSNLSAADEGDYVLTVDGPDGQTLVSDPVSVSVGEGDTFWQRINFQTGSIPAPQGWLADLGGLYGDRGNGESYGWLEEPHAMRQRFNLENPAPSVMHDGLAIPDGAEWEMDVPNGLYRVRLVAGDPDSTDQRQAFSLNENFFFNETTTPDEAVFDHVTPTPDDRWVDRTMTVAVWEGKLRLAPSDLAPDAKVAFLEIDRIYRTVSESEAVIAATPESGLLPLEVDFSTHRSWIKTGESIQSASWDFGDGSSPATGESVTHTFDDPGDFTVTLNLTDSTGAESTDTHQISVGIPVPTITTQPQDVTVPVGDPLNLSVVAEGYGTLEYEWLRSGQVVSGQTAATLDVASATTADSGSYSVRVTNGG